MAGMFYSLQQVAQKLNKTEDEIQEMVKTGKLREFRDGGNILFKIEDVESLMSETAIMPAEEIEIEPAKTKAGEVEVKAEEGGPETEEVKIEEEIPDLKPAESEEVKIDETSFELKEEKPEEEKAAKTEAEEEGISLAEDTGAKEDLISSDTAIIGEETGLDVKGTDVDNLEELMVDTSEGKTGVPAVEGEEDLSLDTFGSGGLLDVSLQADDTSLGGILDEIYTSEGEAETPVEATAPEMEAVAEEMMAEDAHTSLEAALMPMAIEAPPDTMSNAFGIMLIVPLIVVLYTVLMAMLGFNGIMPKALQNLLKNGPYGIHIIWYIMAVAAVAGGLIIGGAAMMSGSAAKPKKKPKAKAPKKPKPKKPKKEKKPKK